ncbi:copper oxidase [Ophiocordyceps camponoti-floridani]|uniref:Copper oxidase n=1 Tax=Ophiocordyceps camponoti-floridani TaxID=2030778 RepID=A0A8H4VE02_9HYPO|nr:copper oxidase [Ophiocordyceps camponoti-floridani]
MRLHSSANDCPPTTDPDTHGESLPDLPPPSMRSMSAIYVPSLPPSPVSPSPSPASAKPHLASPTELRRDLYLHPRRPAITDQPNVFDANPSGDSENVRERQLYNAVSCRTSLKEHHGVKAPKEDPSVKALMEDPSEDLGVRALKEDLSVKTLMEDPSEDPSVRALREDLNSVKARKEDLSGVRALKGDLNSVKARKEDLSSVKARKEDLSSVRVLKGDLSSVKALIVKTLMEDPSEDPSVRALKVDLNSVKAPKKDPKAKEDEGAEIDKIILALLQPFRSFLEVWVLGETRRMPARPKEIALPSLRSSEYR